MITEKDVGQRVTDGAGRSAMQPSCLPKGAGVNGSPRLPASRSSPDSELNARKEPCNECCSKCP